jgi:hypothetical protein
MADWLSDVDWENEEMEDAIDAGELEAQVGAEPAGPATAAEPAERTEPAEVTGDELEAQVAAEPAELAQPADSYIAD